MPKAYKNSNSKNENSTTDMNKSSTNSLEDSKENMNNSSFNSLENSTTNMNNSSFNSLEDSKENMNNSSLDFNSSNIESKLKDRKCKTKEDCFNIGECDTNSGMCKFKDIYCTRENCFLDNGCNMSYIKNAKPQYLKKCEMNTVRIFETCHPEISNTTCVTRECVAHEQCLSHKCYYSLV